MSHETEANSNVKVEQGGSATLAERNLAAAIKQECSVSRLRSEDDASADAHAAETSHANSAGSNRRWAKPLAGYEGVLVKIVDEAEAEGAYAGHLSLLGFSDARRVSTLMDRIRERGDSRKLGTAGRGWRRKLDQLEKKFPNFSEVIDYLRTAHVLGDYSDNGPVVGPILLNGPAGIGKSSIAQTLGDLFCSGLVTQRMEIAQAAAALVGSADYWGNTKPGLVLTTLLEGDYANPVFFLDEVDKAPEGNYDPLGSLYSLLEPTTAKQHRDQSFPWLSVDASRIIWVCTSNDAELLPPSLLNRMRRFDVPPLTEEQTFRLVYVMFAEVLLELPRLKNGMRLTEKAAGMLVAFSPRELRRALREAVGRALYARRKQVTERDVRIIAQTDVACSSRIGFLP
jgi:hypothetical protein